MVGFHIMFFLTMVLIFVNITGGCNGPIRVPYKGKIERSST
jgi:hypothetical protein